LRADATLLWRPFPTPEPPGIATKRVARESQRRSLGLFGDLPTPFPDQLINRRHVFVTPSKDNRLSRSRDRDAPQP
jgi:hypothetical protein